MMEPEYFKQEFIRVYDDMVNSLNSWRWVSVKDSLPPLFENVLVYGVVDKLNVCPQGWIARRWTGWTSGWEGKNEGKEPPWEWLTKQDTRVANVTHWMSLPKME